MWSKAEGGRKVISVYFFSIHLHLYISMYISYTDKDEDLVLCGAKLRVGERWAGVGWHQPSHSLLFNIFPPHFMFVFVFIFVFVLVFFHPWKRGSSAAQTLQEEVLQTSYTYGHLYRYILYIVCITYMYKSIFW